MRRRRRERLQGDLRGHRKARRGRSRAQGHARKVEKLLLATDPDREGEAIAWHLPKRSSDRSSTCSACCSTRSRRRACETASTSPRDLDTYLYEAQRTRRVLDRIGGYAVEPALAQARVRSLGRPRADAGAAPHRRSPARDRRVRSRAYWIVGVALARQAQPPPFTARRSVTARRREARGRATASSTPALRSRPRERRATASRRSRSASRSATRPRRTPPPSCSRTRRPASASAQARDARRAGALRRRRPQEGRRPGRSHHVHAYRQRARLRRGRRRVPRVHRDDLRQEVAAREAQRLQEQEETCRTRTKRSVRRAWTCRPTRCAAPHRRAVQAVQADLGSLRRVPDDRRPSTTRPASRSRRSRARSRRTHLARASGSVLKFAGWRAVYGGQATTAVAARGRRSKGNDGGNGATADDGKAPRRRSPPEEATRTLPELNEGEALALVDPPGVVTKQKHEPPPYFNEASLVKKLEEEGIGRPSTYAEILSKVQARDYVEKVGDQLVPTRSRQAGDRRPGRRQVRPRRLELHAQAGGRPRRGRGRQAAKRLDVLARFTSAREADRHAPRSRRAMVARAGADRRASAEDCGKAS